MFPFINKGFSFIWGGPRKATFTHGHQLSLFLGRGEDSYPSQGTAVKKTPTKLNHRSVSTWDQPKPALPSAALPSSPQLWWLILHPSHHLSFPAVQGGRVAAFGSSVDIGLIKLQPCPQLTWNNKKKPTNQTKPKRNTNKQTEKRTWE